jgi:hypothetical protein
VLENYGAQSPVLTDVLEVLCRNCGRKRLAMRVVARLLPRDTEGRPYTEVCHECLNEESLTRRKSRAKTP